MSTSELMLAGLTAVLSAGCLASEEEIGQSPATITQRRIASAIVVAADSDPKTDTKRTDKSLRTTADAPPAAQESTAAERRQRQREQEFQKTLTGAKLTGTWQMTGAEGLADKGPLTAPKPEHYTITSVAKGLDDNWVITARIQFGDQDVHVPVAVRVVWAGDTPVITLDDVAIPLIGTYSARVMIYRDFYSGAWASDTKNYGGTMAGRITRRPPRQHPKPGKKEAPSTQEKPPSR